MDSADARIDALQAQVATLTTLMLQTAAAAAQAPPAPKKSKKNTASHEDLVVAMPPPADIALPDAPPAVAAATQAGLYSAAAKKPKNDYATPPEGVAPIVPYLRGFERAWEPCCGQGHVVRHLESEGFDVIGSDIKFGPQWDMYEYAPDPATYDVIVTNPPFSKKTLTLERLYDIGKPFAILLPVIALDSAPIREMMRVHGEWGILLPAKTINFIDMANPDAKSRSFFHSGWFAWKLPALQGLVFEPKPGAAPAPGPAGTHADDDDALSTNAHVQ